MCHTSSILSVGETSDGKLALTGFHVSCANVLCRRTTVKIAIRTVKVENGSFKPDIDKNPIFDRQIMPENSAKPQPKCVPLPLIEDYVEACRIRDLSPKASATLVRRCLQGMIRDFTGITEATLFKEIDKLRTAVSDGTAPQGVTDETVDAIDHVRSIGNIGAHMEHDINHIVDVEEGEAEALISLVEMLFAEWYVARESRKGRLAKIAAIAADKAAKKSNPSVAS